MRREVRDRAGDEPMRRLRYRLKRQGMLELDAWLSQLEPALTTADGEFLAALEALLACEPHELAAMMRGVRPLPEPLRPWLSQHPIVRARNEKDDDP